MKKDNPVVLFDGVCNLCNGAVQFIVERDLQSQFSFASLQSKKGQELLKGHKIDSSLNSMVLIEGARVYFKSTAALRVVRRLKFPWSLSSLLIALPPFVRDFLYDIIAANRYRWFGKRELCMIPTPGLRERFLDQVY